MQATLRFALSMLVPIALASCKPPSTGPFRSLLALERWHRGDPANEYTMTGLITFHTDDRLPRFFDVDENCGVHYGNWTATEFRPPSFGEVRMQIADREEVSFGVDAEGAGWDAPAGTLAWDSGDTLRVTATGDEAPGFDVEATVPPLIGLTSHDFAALRANDLHVSRDAPLELRWSPTTGDVIVVLMQFAAANAALKERGIWCTYPAGAGAAAVPTTVLEHLLPSTDELNTNIYVGGAVHQKRALEGVDLDVFTFKNEAARIQVD